MEEKMGEFQLNKEGEEEKNPQEQSENMENMGEESKQEDIEDISEEEIKKYFTAEQEETPQEGNEVQTETQEEPQATTENQETQGETQEETQETQEVKEEVAESQEQVSIPQELKELMGQKKQEIERIEEQGRIENFKNLVKENLDKGEFTKLAEILKTKNPPKEAWDIVAEYLESQDVSTPEGRGKAKSLILAIEKAFSAE